MTTHSYRSARGDSSANATSSNNGSNGAFQMPSYTSHIARSSSGVHSPTKQSAASRTSTTNTHKQSGNAHDSDASLLEMLSSTVACLKQKHMDVEALGCLEQSLWLKRRMFGVDNSVVHRALTDVVLSYNAVAMAYLAAAQFDQCLAMLRKAEAITAPGNFRKCESLQILTFNNIGCCYRKLGKLKSALKYLHEAAHLGAACAHVKNLSITHLNLCAIQSQLGRHDLALEHAQAAIFHTQEELVSLEEAARRRSRGEDVDLENDSGDSNSDVLDAKSREEKVISLAVAYHNLAVELEFNGRGDASLQWYKKALQLVWQHREANAALCASFKQIYVDAKRKLEQQRAGASANAGGGGGGGGRGAGGSSRGSSASRTSSNAFSSGSDRRKPLTRPQSAHHHRSSNNTTGADRGRPIDMSYSANVASQCYKPLKPSTAAQQYYATSTEFTHHGNSHSISTGARTARPSSARPSARQRPLSASATRRTGNEMRGDNNEARPNIEAHWRRLEKEFAIDEASAGATTRLSQQQQQQQQRMQPGAQSKRPQSARRAAGYSRTATGSSRVHFATRELDAFASRHDDVISDLDSDGDGNGDELLHEDDDDDCGVIDDDAPSEDENGDRDNDDAISDLLLRRRGSDNDDDRNERLRATESTRDARVRQHQRRDVGSSSEQSNASRGARHRQALDEARRKASAPPSDRSMRSRSHANAKTMTRGAPIDDANLEVLESYDGDEDDSELPSHLRVSHMEYLRRMKRLADTIKDDLAGAASPTSTASSPARSRKLPVHKPVVSRLDDEPPVVTTPRGSTSKVRERLERMRSDSYQRLSESDANELRSPTVDSVAPTLLSPQAAIVIEVVVDDSAVVCTTEQQRVAAEHTLVQQAAAKRIQATVRGGCVRVAARSRQQYLQERELHARAKALVQRALEQREEEQFEGAGDNDEAPALQTQQHAIEHAAATTIQQAFRAHAVQIESAPASPSQSPRTPALQLSDDALPDYALLLQQPQEQTESPCSVDSPMDDAAPQAPSSHSHHHDAAATRIQATIKAHWTRSIVTEHRAATLSRMYVERQHMDVALRHAAANEQQFLEELGATTIQALVRGRQSRLLTEMTRIGRHVAAERIQLRYRAHMRHTLQQTHVGVHSVAARTIQLAYRMYTQRQRGAHDAVVSEERNEVHHIAATSLQRFWRSMVAATTTERQSDEAQLEEMEAATCIQALGRGHLVRKSLTALRASSSSQLDGLAKQASAFSIASGDATDHVSGTPYDDDNYEDDDPALDIAETTAAANGSRRTSNLSFLPPAVRALYTAFLADAPSPASVTSSLLMDTNDDRELLSSAFDSWLHDFTTASDARAAVTALEHLQTSVLTDSGQKTQRTLATAVRIARAIDQRIRDRDVWTLEVEAAALQLLDTFRDVLIE